MRIRTIKPEFFKHEDLFDLEIETGLPMRVAFAGLWCKADREGRFKWRPRAIKADILPYDNLEMSRVLHALWSRGFLVIYEHSGEVFGVVKRFKTHQVINNREKPSKLPSPDDPGSKILTDIEHLLTREARDDNAKATPLKGKGREGKGKERKSPFGGEANSENSPAPVDSENQNPVRLYCSLWKSRNNGQSAVIRPKEAGQLKKLVKDVGWDKAKQIIETYFAMPDPLFIRRGYDVGTLVMNIAAITQFRATGKVVTKKVVENIEQRIDKAQGTGKRRRSLEEIEAERQAQLKEASMAKLGAASAN